MQAEQGELFENPYRVDGTGPYEYAAKESIDELRKAGALDRSHSLAVEFIIGNSRLMDYEFERALRSKTSIAYTNLYRAVYEQLRDLPTAQQAFDDTFARLAKALNDAE